MTAVWNTWPVGHYGPIIDYIAKCPASGCSSWKADSGSPWIKVRSVCAGARIVAEGDIDWTESVRRRMGLRQACQGWVHTRHQDPKEPGIGRLRELLSQYHRKQALTHFKLIRHEQLALHGASSPGGAQFYPGRRSLSPQHMPRTEFIISVHPDYRYRWW